MEKEKKDVIVRITGNTVSTAIYLPAPIIEMLSVEKGDYVRLRVEKGKLLVIPVRLE